MLNNTKPALQEIIRRTKMDLSMSPYMSAQHIKRFCEASILNAVSASDGVASPNKRMLTKVLQFEMPGTSPGRATFGGVAKHISDVIKKSCPATELFRSLVAFYFKCFDLSEYLAEQHDWTFSNKPEMKDLVSVYRFLKSTPYLEYDDFLSECEPRHVSSSHNRFDILNEVGLNYGETPLLKLYSALKDVQFYREADELDELDEDEVKFSPLGSGFAPEAGKYGILLHLFVFPIADAYAKIMKDRFAAANNKMADVLSNKQQKGKSK